MNIQPLRNNIMFKFLDESGGEKNKFQDRQRGLIVLPKLDSTQKQPRWGVVVAAGPDADVKPGEYIFIEGLMWSYGVSFEGEKLWKTDDTKVIFATDDVEATYATEI